MRSHRVFLACVVTTLLFFPGLSHAQSVDGPTITKPVAKCPRHYSKHKDDHGGAWCMDSSGRNYTPENARYVAKAGMKTKRKNVSEIDLAKLPGTINN
jgi:hypothetical protein